MDRGRGHGLLNVEFSVALPILLEGLQYSRTRGPERAEKLLSRVLGGFLYDRKPPGTVRREFYHHLRSALTVQCENLGVPWRDSGGEIEELVEMVRLDAHPGGESYTAVLSDDWFERVDRMFGVRTCDRCGSDIFRGPHPRDECDAAAVLAVMES